MRPYLLISMFLFACGGKAVIDGEPGGDGGGGSSSTSSNTGGSSSTGGSIQGIRLEGAFAYVDCLSNGSGNVFVEFTMSFENVSPQSATIEIVEARLQGAVGQTTLAVTPDSVIVSPLSTEQFAFSTTGPGSGTLACDWCMSMDTDLEIEFFVDAVPRTFTGTVSSVSCSN